MDQLIAELPEELRAPVHFLNSVPHDELTAFYQKATMLVNPSFSESFGMSLIEAMACEKPVIASAVGGMVEIIRDKVTGGRGESGDEDALADGMISLSQDEKLCEKLGRAGRNSVKERFSWDVIVSQLVAQYASIFPSGQAI